MAGELEVLIKRIKDSGEDGVPLSYILYDYEPAGAMMLEILVRTNDYYLKYGKIFQKGGAND